MKFNTSLTTRAAWMLDLGVILNKLKDFKDWLVSLRAVPPCRLRTSSLGQHRAGDRMGHGKSCWKPMGGVETNRPAGMSSGPDDYENASGLGKKT